MRYENVKGLINKGGFNLYRGCDHNCIYCDSRSRIYNIEGEFTDIIVKQNAPQLMEEYLRKRQKKEVLQTGSMTDPYNHVEKRIGLFLELLKLIEKYHFGISLLTKSDLVLRDIEILKKINQNYRAVVAMTLTTTEDELAKKIEPNVTLPTKRLEALKKLNDEGILTGVWISPILPFICDNEENIVNIVNSCANVGVKFIVYFGFGTTMREGSREYFYEQMDIHFPGFRSKYERQYGLKYVCNSPHATKLDLLFKDLCQKHQIIYDFSEIKKLISREKIKQLSLFE